MTVLHQILPKHHHRIRQRSVPGNAVKSDACLSYPNAAHPSEDSADVADASSGHRTRLQDDSKSDNRSSTGQGRVDGVSLP